MKRRSVWEMLVFNVSRFLSFYLVIALVTSSTMLLFLEGVELDEEIVRRNAPETFVWTIGMALIGCGLDALRRHMTVDRPLSQIITALERIGKGDFEHRLDSGHRDFSQIGFREICDGVNRLAGELEGVETMKTDFIANVSHELKTPLAAVRNYATLLREPDLPERQRQEYVGLSPSQARGNGAKLKVFSRLSIKITLEGGTTMNYRIEEKKALKLVGYKKRFTGTPMERSYQDHNFTCETRLNQAVLQWMAHDCDTSYCVFSNFGDDGYDYTIASWLGEETSKDLAADFDEEIASRFEDVTVPAGTYLICETPRCKWPCDVLEELYRRAVTELLPSAGYELTEGPEVEVVHWFYRPGDEELNSSRYVELWLPVRKR